MRFWGLLACIHFLVVSVRADDARIDAILNVACEKGDLPAAYRMATELSGSLSGDDSRLVASTLHIKSCLELVTQGNYSAAVNYHQEAKAADKTVVPPLAALHLAEKTCGGISDIFFVSAVIIKELANEDKEATKPREIPMMEFKPASPAFAKQVYDGFQTLITLTFDSGLHMETDRLVNRAISMLSDGVDAASQTYADKQKLLAFRIRSALLSPAVFESFSHLEETRLALTDRVLSLAADLKDSSRAKRVHLAKLDEFVVSPTFYFVYQGYKDRYFLEALHDVYSAAYPDINDVHVEKGHKNPYIVNKGSKTTKKKKEKEAKGGDVDPTALVLDDMEGLSPEEMLRRMAQKQREKQEKQDRKTEKKAAKKEKRRLLEQQEQLKTPVKVAFLSAHLRKHSICKLFCGVIGGLSKLPTPEGERPLEVFAFSALQEDHEDQHTAALKTSLQSREHFVRVGKTVVSNRGEVAKRGIDVLVFLDVGMDPSTMIWGSARLAPLQVCLWGHPTTTGFSHMDYFVSSDAFHRDVEEAHSASDVTVTFVSESSDGGAAATAGLGDMARRHMTTTALGVGANSTVRAAAPAPAPAYDGFTEQLLMFDSLGFHFSKPDTSSVRREDSYAKTGNPALRALLESRKKTGKKLVLFPQHLPKLHPGLDEVFREILTKVPNSQLVLVFGASRKQQWKRTVEKRWGGEDSLGEALLRESDEHGDARIVWLDNLQSEEYLTLLQAGDIMLDPFPFGGGVTTLESLAVCTPVLTLPVQQTVPALAAGMIRQWGAHAGDLAVTKALIASSTRDFIDKAVALLGGGAAGVSPQLQALRESACKHNDVLYSSEEAVREWGDLLWGLF